ncbi:MAG: hypothetical protein BZ138_07030 [Methanosphaera sp. rholeuAM270]|nr:MAG: hypothetical protein BZ138_07030 [Methanosphaera sp. rholeuAM270]
MFSESDTVTKLKDHMCSKYGTTPETPWEQYPNHKTFKTNRRAKWYAIIMQVRRDRIYGGDDDELIWVMNVKASPDKISDLINNKHIFPAYHMNKKHWITIVLSASLDTELAKNLIDNSYELVEK